MDQHVMERMSEEDARLWALAEEGQPRLPIVSEGEARAVIGLLQILSSSDGAGSDLAYELSGAIARRLPTET